LSRWLRRRGPSLMMDDHYALVKKLRES
jgi:hypothetical protein